MRIGQNAFIDTEWQDGNRRGPLPIEEEFLRRRRPMLKTLSLVGAALAMTAGAVVPLAPAQAQRYGYDQSYRDGYSRDGYSRDGYNGYDRSYRGSDRSYRGYNRSYRARQKCNDGDGGTIVGAIAGGLLGNTVAGRGDRTLGTILGAGVGALAGRAIDRSDRPGYCRR
jgi:hypothetical protein